MENSKKPALAEAVGSIIGGTEKQNVNSGLLVFSAPYGRPEGAAKNISSACVFSPLFCALEERRKRSRQPRSKKEITMKRIYAIFQAAAAAAVETLARNRRCLTTLKVARGAARVICAVVLLPRANVHAQASAFANFEGSQTNPIRMSADGTGLFAVNTPNQTLSVFDLTVPTTAQLIAEIPVGLEPVSVNPVNDDTAWVVNQVSNTISVVSVSKGIVVATISAKTEPMDV